MNKQFKDDVTKAIETFNSIDTNVFYTALALYDIAGITNPTVSQCKKVSDVVDSVNTIYDEFLREDVRQATK